MSSGLDRVRGPSPGPVVTGLGPSCWSCSVTGLGPGPGGAVLELMEWQIWSSWLQPLSVRLRLWRATYLIHVVPVLRAKWSKVGLDICDHNWPLSALSLSCTWACLKV